tara:strand:+ start:2286 stop:3623 length:1338 start_codon:yes stop_codon:yes gene_type:complete
MHGVLFLQNNTYYELTPTHLCWKTSPSSYDDQETPQIPILVDDVTKKTSITVVGNILTPASSCVNKSALEFWPVAAVYERNWLALNSDFLFEASSTKLADRRAVVEQSLSCAPNSTALEVYELDCLTDVYATCQTTPSVPFRRLSESWLTFHFHSDSYFYAKNMKSLGRLSGSRASESIFFALTRLVVLLIVAFVVYSRSNRQSTSPFFTFSNALRVASAKEHFVYHSLFNTVADAMIGLLAVVARIVVLATQAELLLHDHNTVVFITEVVGIAVSMVHFMLRNIVLQMDLRKESPLTKLGGGMALSDASVAALVSVTVSPLLAASNRDFDSISRLFCGVLIAFFVLQRVWVASAACALLAHTTSSDRAYSSAYSGVLLLSTLLWIVQGVSVGVCMSRLFVLPQSFSLARGQEGSGFSLSLLIALAVLAIQSPALNAMNVKLSKL